MNLKQIFACVINEALKKKYLNSFKVESGSSLDEVKIFYFSIILTVTLKRDNTFCCDITYINYD